MRRYGFHILAMWEAKTERRTEFVYLLEWPDEQTKTNAWAAFMEDREWAEIKRAHQPNPALWSARLRIVSSCQPTTCCDGSHNYRSRHCEPVGRSLSAGGASRRPVGSQ
jgi:hypothetical protein